MKKVLVLGAGMVARPLVRYLLDQPDLSLTVASRTVSKAQALIDGHPDGTALPLLADDTTKLEGLISRHDLSVSLLPAPLHPVVAKLCIKHRRHMVTTSYVSPQMQALDRRARDAGVTVLNEIGVDPGIDHMSAMRIIDQVKGKGGQVVSFRSYCGGLPAPQVNDNPWGYKVSWSPRAVCTAGQNAGRYRQDGKLVEVPGPELFTHYHAVNVPGVGDLEAYPNRDSLGYIDVYNLEGIATMFRGTLRYPGWCDTLKKVVDLGLLDETPVTFPPGTTYAQLTVGLLGSASSGNLRTDAAAHLGLDESSPILDRMEWLGLFAEDPLPEAGTKTTRLDMLAALIGKKLPYAPGEPDMIVMRHEFLARFTGRGDQAITSTLVAYGQPDGDSAMARTVSLPAAMAAAMIVTGRIHAPGVHIPVAREVYDPVLDELTTRDISFDEQSKPAG